MKTCVLVGGPDDGKTFAEPYYSGWKVKTGTARWRDGSFYYLVSETPDRLYFLYADDYNALASDR